MTTPPANQIARLEHVVREQMKEIDRQRAEIDNLVAWITGERDALTALQVIYNDIKASEANRVRAAAAAIGFERPKLTATANLVVVDFRERVRQARLKAPFAKTIEHIPEPEPA
jgi:hypothetical protein